MTLGPGKGGRSGGALRPSKTETKTGVTGWRRWRSPVRDTEDTARRSMPRRSPLRSRLAMRRTAPVREPLTSSAETKNVRAVRGGTGDWVLYQGVHFGHFPVLSVVHHPPTGREAVNTLGKPRVTTAPPKRRTSPRSAQCGGYRRLGFVPRGTFWSFPRSIGGTSPPYRTGSSEHFGKGPVPVGVYKSHL